MKKLIIIVSIWCVVIGGAALASNVFMDGGMEYCDYKTSICYPANNIVDNEDGTKTVFDPDAYLAGTTNKWLPKGFTPDDALVVDGFYTSSRQKDIQEALIITIIISVYILLGLLGWCLFLYMLKTILQTAKEALTKAP